MEIISLTSLGVGVSAFILAIINSFRIKSTCKTASCVMMVESKQLPTVDIPHPVNHDI